MSSLNRTSLVLACLAIGVACALAASPQREPAGDLGRFKVDRAKFDVRMLKDDKTEQNAKRDRDEAHRILDLAKDGTDPNASDVEDHGPESESGSGSIPSRQRLASPENNQGASDEFETQLAVLKRQLERKDKLIQKLSSDLVAIEVRQDKEQISNMEAKEAQIRKLEEDLKRLERDIQESRARLENKTGEHQASLAEIRKREESIAQLNEGLEKIRANSEQAREALKGEFEARGAAIEKLKGELQVAETNLKNANNSKKSLATEQQAKEATIRDLKAELNKVKAAAREAEVNADKEKKALSERLASLESALKGHVDSAKTGADGLKQRDATIEKLETDLKRLQMAVAESQRALEGKRSAHTASLDEIREKDEAIMKLRGDLQTLESETKKVYETLSNKLKEHEKKSAELEGKDAMIAALQAELEVAQKSLKSKGVELDKRDARIAELEGELKKLKWEFEKQVRVLNGSMLQKEQFSAKQLKVRDEIIEKQSKAFATLEAELGIAKKSLEGKGGVDKVSEAELQKRDGRIAELEADIKKLKWELDSRAKAVQNTIGQKERLSVNQLKARDADIAKLKSGIAELYTKMLGATKSESERSVELEQKKVLIKKLEADLEKLDKLVKECQNDLKGKTDEHKASLQALMERDKAILDLRADVELLESNSQQLKEALDNWSKTHNEKLAELVDKFVL